MVMVLLDHMSEHVLRVLLKRGASNARATPGNFFPDHETKLVAQIKYETVLLVVSEANEVGTHLTNEPDLLADKVVAHCGSHTRMVCVTLSATQQDSLAVQLEWPVFDKFYWANSKAFFETCLS